MLKNESEEGGKAKIRSQLDERKVKIEEKIKKMEGRKGGEAKAVVAYA